eukprot:TRINITY_DN549_c1_g2_i2.p1 TRINITY_DN549_c1_g2~~TRINITY_DN549_c1_g2_i2.p1  ORF type:complete len:352 (+),score=100.46 TRINITY_DN549_c1_g2_i2:623-1678(+)
MESKRPNQYGRKRHESDVPFHPRLKKSCPDMERFEERFETIQKLASGLKMPDKPKSKVEEKEESNEDASSSQQVRITKETSIKAEFMFQLAKMRGKTVTQAIEDMYSAEDFPQDCRNSIKSFFRKLGYHRNEIVLNFSESKPLVKFVKKKINVDSEKEPLVPAIESKTKPMSSKSKPTKHELEKKIQELTEENELMKEEGEEQKEKNAQTVKKMKKLGEDLDEYQRQKQQQIEEDDSENGSSTSSESDEEGSDSDNEEEYNGNFERKSDHVDPGSVDKESPPHIIKAHLKDDSKPDGMRDITPRDRYIDNEYLIYEVRAFGKTKHCSFRELPECDSIASDLKSKRYMHPNK